MHAHRLEDAARLSTDGMQCKPKIANGINLFMLQLRWRLIFGMSRWDSEL